MGCLILDFPASRIVSQMNYFFLYIIQSQVFCYSNTKQTKTVAQSENICKFQCMDVWLGV